VLAQTSRTAVYGPVRTVVWEGSAGDRRPYPDQGDFAWRGRETSSRTSLKIFGIRAAYRFVDDFCATEMVAMPLETPLHPPA
jgi:hypothetical protein